MTGLGSLGSDNVIDDFHGDLIWLSNFARWPCQYEGIFYLTSEHAYQAAKSLDISVRRKIAALRTPRESKNEGRKINCRPDWEEVKYGVMHNILLDKFTRNKEVYQKLMATGEVDLIEGNTWHDNYWGSCSCEKCGNKGENNLGKILMSLRERFRKLQ